MLNAPSNSVPERDSSDSSGADSNTDSGVYNWNQNAKNHEKHELAYKIVQSVNSTDDFYHFFKYLRRVDFVFYRDYGGEILNQVLDDKKQRYTDSFDQRYLRLLQLFSNHNLTAASAFNQRAEEVYRVSSNTLVRFDRIMSSIKNAAGVLATYKQDETNSSQYSILPMAGGWETQQYAMQQKQDFVNASQSSRVALGRIALENVIERKASRLSELGDCDVAEPKWLNRANLKNAERIGLYSLPETRISKSPTGIAFRLDKQWRYINPSSDLYHYFRISGKTIFGAGSKKIEKAYVLPRLGGGNYYCSLLNRLPSLYAYHLLGLDIPIISSYELNEIEFYFAKKMGIDISKIEVDRESELVIKNSIVPTLSDLKILFARFCMSLPKSKSPFGQYVYISRASSPDRVMKNEAELEQLLVKYGFDIVVMEKYKLEDQMAIAGNAKLIVAPHGAGLANMIFSKPSTGIFELVPAYYMQSSFRQLAIDCGHKYCVQLGDRTTPNSVEDESVSWEIDLNKFEKVLLDILGNE